MEILILVMIPGLIVFDLIPQAFGYKGLVKWYSDNYQTEADILIFLVYLPFSILCAFLIYLLCGN